MAFNRQRSNINTIIDTILSLKYNGICPVYHFRSYLDNMLCKLLKQFELKMLHGS